MKYNTKKSHRLAAFLFAVAILLPFGIETTAQATELDKVDHFEIDHFAINDQDQEELRDEGESDFGSLSEMNLAPDEMRADEIDGSVRPQPENLSGEETAEDERKIVDSIDQGLTEKIPPVEILTSPLQQNEEFDEIVRTRSKGQGLVPAVFTLQWTSPTATGRVYDADGVCQLTPANNSDTVGTAGTASQATVTFSLGGDTPAQPGEVEIRLPQYVFKDRDGNSQGTLVMGVSDKQEGATGFFYYLDNTTNEVVISNYEAIEPAYVFKCDVLYHSVSTGEYPSNIADKYYNEFNADVTITLGDATPIEAETTTIALQYNTRAKLGTLSKSVSTKFEVWLDAWGERPADADDYFYVVWELRQYLPNSNTQPFTITFSDTPDVNGEIVGVGLTSDLADCVGVTTISSDSIVRPSTSASFGRLNYVLTRHSRAKVDEGITDFTNNAQTDLLGVDGATDSKSAKSDYSYSDPKFEYSEDESNTTKTFSGTYGGGINKLESGNDLAISNGIVYGTARGWGKTLAEGADPSVYENYGAVPYTIELTDDLMTLGSARLQDGDYAFTSMSLSIIERNYLQNEQTGVWSVSEDNDYADWEPATILYQIGTTGDWQILGEVTRIADGSYVFTDALSGETFAVANLLGVGGVELPAGTTGVRALHESTYYESRLSLNLFTTLYPTDHVLSLLAGENDVDVYNVSSLRVFDSKDNWSDQRSSHSTTGAPVNAVQERDETLYGTGTFAQHAQGSKKLKRATTGTGASKTANYINDITNGLVKTTYKADMYEFFNYDYIWTLDEVLAAGIIQPQQEGVFCDLLPMGMNVDAASINVWTYRDVTNYSSSAYNSYRGEHTVEFVENWRDSGRTMMIIHVTAPTGRDNILPSTRFCHTGFHLEYDAYYSWDNVLDYGNSPRNSIAYRSGAGAMGGNARADDGGTIVDKALMTDLDGDGNPEGTPTDTLYAQVNTAFDFPVSMELSFNKRVKTAEDLQYGDETATIGGGDYSYRLRLASQQGMKTDDIVIYDVLESFNPADDNRWNGTFSSLDLSQPLSKGVAVVTFYSTQTGLDMADGADRDLSDSAKWSDVPPVDLSAVTALAFDMRQNINDQPYVLPPEEAISVIIHMKAPVENVKELEESAARAYNSAWFTGTTTSIMTGAANENVLETLNTAVSIRSPQIELHKQSDPVTGTESAPTNLEVDDDLVYDLSVTNRETALVLQNIKITDTIPLGLIIDFDNLKWYTGSNPANAALVSASSRVEAIRDEQRLSFTIDKLAAGETAHLLIPTTVADYGNAMLYQNTAKITKVGGADYELESETTYHEKIAKFYDLIIGKIVGPPIDDDGEGGAVGHLGSTTGERGGDPSFRFEATIGEQSGEPTGFVGIIHDKEDNPTTESITFPLGETVIFELKDGESIVIEGLPRGTTYAVQEEDYRESYDTVVEGQTSGAMRDDVLVTFYNVPHPTTPFSFVKVDAEDQNILLEGAMFSLYRLVCAETDSAHLHDEPSETSSCWTLSATARSEADGKVDFGELVGGCYKLLENHAPAGYDLLTDGWDIEVDPREDNPVIITSAGESLQPTFKEGAINEWLLPNLLSPSHGDLTVSKTVSGDGASKTKTFIFTVTLDDPTIEGVYGDLTFVEGVANFGLAHGESKTANDLPAGIGYRVIESENDGYTVTVNQTLYTEAVDAIVEDEVVVAAFNNDRPADPTARPVTVDLSAKKTVDGVEPGNLAFDFQLKAEDGRILQTGRNDDKGRITFAELSFHQPGIHTFYMQEKVGDETDMRYDRSIYSATIEITEEVTAGGRSLSANLTYQKDNQDYVGEPVFANNTIPTKPTSPGDGPTDHDKMIERSENGKPVVKPWKNDQAIPRTGERSTGGTIGLTLALALCAAWILLQRSRKKNNESHNK